MYIFFLLIITILLFKTLFNVFGFTNTKNVNDKDEAIKNFLNNIVNNSDNTKENTNNNNNINNIKYFENIYNNHINKIKNVTDNTDKTDIKQVFIFDEELFLKLSEKAITMILNSFSENRLDILKQLMTNNMYLIFEKNVLENQKNNMFYKTVLVSIKDKNIIEKDIKDNSGTIKLSLKMQQINYIEDKNGDIISGSKDRINEVNEIWVFVKNIDNNSWLLSSIE